MNNRNIRIGLIGTGRFGRLHLKVFQEIPGASVLALSDIHRQELMRTAQQYGISEDNCYEDPLDLIKRPDLDAVDIVTDEKSHGSLVLAGLQHGKHVIVEKPLCVSYQEAVEIEKAQQLSGKQVLVGNISRFSQPYFSIKKTIESGRLGKVAAIRAKRNFSKSWFDSFGNRIHPVYESGIHDIDLMIWYAEGSKCVKVAAFESYISGYRYPDLFSAILTFDNGLVASIDSSWMVPAGGPQNLVETLELGGLIDAHIEVIGENATAQYQLAHPGLSVWTDNGVLLPETTLWPTGPDGVGGAIRTELEHFVKTIASDRPSPIMPLQHAVQASKIADAIVQSAAQNTVIHLE